MTCQLCFTRIKQALPQKCVKQTNQKQLSVSKMHKKSHQIQIFIICGNCSWRTKITSELWVTTFSPIVCLLIISEEEISFLNIFPLSSPLSLTEQDINSLKRVKKHQKELCELKSVQFVVTKVEDVGKSKLFVKDSSFEKETSRTFKTPFKSVEGIVDIHTKCMNDIVNNIDNEVKVIVNYPTTNLNTCTDVNCDVTTNDCHISDTVVIENENDNTCDKNESELVEKEKEEAPSNNVKRCVILPQSELSTSTSECENVNEKGENIKDIIRRSTTPLEPSPLRPVSVVAAPAIQPDGKQDADESRDQERAERSGSSEVVTDSVGARRIDFQLAAENHNDRLPRSQSETNIYIDGPQSLNTPGGSLSSSSFHRSNTMSSLPVNSSSQDSGCESAAGASVVQHNACFPPKHIFEPTDSTLPKPKESKPTEESKSLSSEVGTFCTETNEVEEEVEHTNIAHPTSDQVDRAPSEVTNAPRSKFEPLEAIIDKLADGDNVLPQVSMRYEMLRLFTLHTYPKENKPYIIRLAQAGFYYANNGDEVVCYCCGYRRNMWEETDNPWVIHQRLNPNCKFLLKNEEVNVKISAARQNGKVSAEKTAIHCVTSHTGSKISQFGSGRINSGNIESMSNDVSSTTVNATSTASNEASRDSRRSHGGFSSLNETTQSSSTSQQQTTNALVATKASAVDDSLADIRLNQTRVKFPQYADIEKRRATFDGCDSIVIPISSLVESGLFHTGYGDCCRCHVCGIGLRHWSPNDDPWVEHARWSRQCDFVLLKKGQEFIDLVHMAVDISQNGGESATNGLTNTQGPRRTTQEPSELDCLMRCSPAQSLLEMGYSTGLIRIALQAVIAERGRSAINAQVLTEKVFEIETQRRQHEVVPTKTEGTCVTSQGDKSRTNTPSVPTDEKSQRLVKKRLAEENALLKQQSICTVCKKNSVCIVFLPCGHLVTCDTCAPGVKYCNLPECGKFIKGTVRTYFS